MIRGSESEPKMNRRKVLRTFGATGAAMAGFAGAASGKAAVGVSGALPPSATDAEVLAYREYANDRSKIRRAFDAHIDSVAEVMEDNDASAPSSLNEAESVDVVPDTKDGMASAHIIASFDGGETTFHIYPQANRAYARKGTGTEKVEFDPTKGAETMGCYYEYDCDCPSNCGYYMGYETVYNVCTYSDGTTESERIGGHCSCDDSPNPCFG